MKRTALSDTAKWIGKEIAASDRIGAKYAYATSEAQAVRSRVNLLDQFEATRPVCYALAWGISTGRASADFGKAILALSANRFAQMALDVAERCGVGAANAAVWEAWKEAVSC